MQIYNLDQIKNALNVSENLSVLLQSQQQAFLDFSNEKITLPLPIQLNFKNNCGDCHIKAGFKDGDDYFVVKIATGFYDNYIKNLPAGDGAILVFSQDTGLLKAILLDAGYLTTLRTALAACVAAQLTPFQINNIGIIGTGNLANICLKLLKILYPQAQFLVWGRNIDKVQKMLSSFQFSRYSSLSELVAESDLVITATASKEPVIFCDNIKPSIHIIGLGADESNKNEIDSQVFKNADYIIVDSIKQAMKYGDTANAFNKGIIDELNIKEIGEVLSNKNVLSANRMITSLTGIAAQDIAISNYVINNISA